jgi:DNA transformation protein
MKDDFAFLHDLFAAMAPVQIRRMFGGAGVYRDGVMFALVAEGVVYLKIDEGLKKDLEAAGSQPFVWVPDSGPKAGKTVTMSYWRLPEDAWDDPEIAASWGRRALSVALQAAKAKPKAKTAPKKKPPR